MHYFRPIFCFVLLLCIASASLAQRSEQFVVYLKNGSQIRGTLVEETSDGSVKIQTADRSIWVFEKERIEKTAYEPKAKKLVSYPSKGMFGQVDFGILAGRGTYYNRYLPSANLTLGYQFNPKFSAGIGSGWDYMELGLAPVFADARYNFFNKALSPYVGGQLGYAFPYDPHRNNWWGGQDNRYYGGLMAGLRVGVRKYFFNNTALNFSIGYKGHHTRYRYTQNWWNVEDDAEHTQHSYFNSIEVRIGFLFN